MKPIAKLHVRRPLSSTAEPLSRRRFLQFLSGGAAAVGGAPFRLSAAEAAAAAGLPEPVPDLIPAPQEPREWPAFRRQLAAWREGRRRELNYSDALYRRADFAWVSGNFACAFLMLNDALFYDPDAGVYTVPRFLEHGRSEFGGFDSVVLWHAYPRLGLDARNQFDCYREQPGGLAGLRRAVGAFHRGGVRVFLNYNPWDTETRREGRPDVEVLAELVGTLDADGIFLDTLSRSEGDWRQQLDAARAGVALESELALPLERVADHHLSWAQWFEDSATPGVLRNKWFERRHQQHQIKRWDRDHSGELHTAWMNGSGVLIWENVFGTWNGWCARDKSMLRAMLPLQRRFAGLFAGEGWTPLVPTLAPGVFASLWENEHLRLWTLVNRNEREVKGPLFEAVFREREKVWDAVMGQPAQLGRPFQGVRQSSSTPMPVVGFLPARGIGCYIAGRLEEQPDDFLSFLDEQRTLLKRADWGTAFPTRRTELRPPDPAADLLTATVPAEMVRVPGGRVRMTTEFRVRECGFYEATHAHFETRFPALHGQRTFEREVVLQPFAIDAMPVTNAQYARFLQASGHQPRDPASFLRHWVEGAPPPGREDHPVVHVDLDDARAYARWAGKRLPTEEEWQYTAQGSDQRRYPWGNDWKPDCCNDGQSGDTTPVMAFPEGRSPFGVYDLCGQRLGSGPKASVGTAAPARRFSGAAASTDAAVRRGTSTKGHSR
ncbi:MAG: SUMF1/EgtB/PvdO family nonheme iron enzyme [Verrucomicrobiales bacterium]|nr:SUMF1/EgtB/PvdO family nonheme iron enzyme [Verrucomicrobiales bacterium]